MSNETIHDLLHYRGALAAAVAGMRINRNDFSIMGFSTTSSIPETNRPLFSYNYGIQNTDQSAHAIISRLCNDWKRLGAVLVARYDEENPTPTMQDIWTFGEIQGDGYYHYDKRQQNHVCVVDFIVVAPDATWKSVIRDTALRDEVICPKCGALDDGLSVWKERDWDEVAADHVPGCEYVAFKTKEAEYPEIAKAIRDVETAKVAKIAKPRRGRGKAAV